MLTTIQCVQEKHPFGGQGDFFSMRAQELLPELLKTYAGQVQLIYLDPPFGTGDQFFMKQNGARIETPVYEDTLHDGDYIDMMRTVLTGCHALLSPTGSLYLHVDYRKSAKLRLVLDEVFGEANLMNEIIWMYKSGGRSTRHYSRKHDTILFYRKSAKAYFNIEAAGVPRGPERRNHMKRFIDADGRISYSIRSGGKTYVYHEDMPVYPSDVWTDIEHLHQRDPERNGYATQKPEALLRRIILASSKPGDIVADFFSGSGTTAAVASQTGRRFLAGDESPFALLTLRKRQCMLYSAMSLFDQSSPMRLHFPATCAFDLPVQAELKQDDSICSISSQGDVCLLYCALGNLDVEGAFVPHMYVFDPKLPLDIHIEVCENAVLHVVDMQGRQGFWQVN